MVALHVAVLLSPLLMAAGTDTYSADPAYPPCTQYRTDSCTQPPPQRWPTLYIPCPPDTYCPPTDIPHRGKEQVRTVRPD
jgi:hypothetical protein